MVRTYSGAMAGWEDPAPLEDYLVQLGRIPRFTGATEPEFTVLQHCYHAYLIAGKKFPEVALQALLHDFAEILIGDIPTPTKFRGYAVREKRHVELAAASFGLDLDWSEKTWAKVEMVDHDAFGAERYYLTTGGDWLNIGRKQLDKVIDVRHDRREGPLHNLIGRIIEEAAR